MILSDKVGKWKRSKALAHVRVARCILVVVMSMLGGLGSASAFTTLDREACWSAWTNAFYYTDSSGRGYLRANESSSNGAFCGSWTFTSEIEVVNSAALVGLATPAMVNGILEGWTNQNGVDWSDDGWNDDVTGEARAFISGYQVTGNTNWLMLAKYGFDLGYSRGYIATNGGVLECTSGCVETAETTDGMIQVAYFLAQYLPDPTYMTKAQNLYGFLITNELVASTGMVEGTPNDGVSSTAASDYGFVMYDSIILGYTNNAYLAAAFATNAWGLGASGTFYGSPGFFLRAMGLTGIDTNFGIAVCDNAWSWRDSRGLSEQWTYRESDTNVDYCYDTMDLVMGMLALPPDAPPTLPVTANDVVGSQVTFTAAFPSGMTYQWQKISGGVTNNISGATNVTLTLNNLQLTDTASYQLVVSNANGVAVSSPGVLTVRSVPPPVNNVITAYADQTGLGEAFGDFTPTWTVSPGSLIAGLAPSSAIGSFSQEWPGRDPNSLTADSSLTIGTTPNGSTSVNYVTCGIGGGSNIVYTLPASANGYNLTNITIYGGWVNNGRDQQAYTISYATASAPGTFITLGSANYLPSVPAGVQSATRATWTASSGYLATNVAAVKFDFTTPAGENGYEGYSGIDLYGVNITSQYTAAPTNGLAPLTVQFNGPAVDTGGNAIMSWNWNFCDGATSTNQNPSHIYNAAGNYSPGLVVTNNLGYMVMGSGPSISAQFNSGLVVNGSFETGDFTGWTLFGGDPGDNVVSDGAGSGISPHSGNYLAVLGSYGSLSYFSQTLATTAGTRNLLSLWLDSPDGLTPNEFLVSWNGNTLFDETNLPALGWTNLQFSVWATGTSTVLEFGFRDDPSYLGLDDISVVALPTNPANITVQVAGSNLTLIWPSDHIGWRLQMQVNPPGVGLGTNWVDVANSSTTNQITIPIDPTVGNVFYRMVYP